MIATIATRMMPSLAYLYAVIAASQWPAALRPAEPQGPAGTPGPAGAGLTGALNASQNIQKPVAEIQSMGAERAAITVETLIGKLRRRGAKR